jgi:dnd system-associated protein 4
MALNRIRIAKDKAELVNSLLEAPGTTGAFATYADLVMFAAALGARKRRRSPLNSISTTEPAPIALEIFISRGYDVAIKLLAIAETGDPKILSVYDPKAEEDRLKIFEEYANGGLEILREELRGSVDYTERILLILSQERLTETTKEKDFDLTRFL